MKIIERFIMRVFSMLILVASLFTILALLNVVNVGVLSYAVESIQSNITALKITYAVCGVLALMALRGLFARLKPVDLAKGGIILENGSGKLVISKESLENLVSSVAKDIPGTESISSKTILDKNRNLKISVNVVVSQDVMLKDLSLELQKRIKDAMLRTADLEVKQVDVRIKNISNKKVKKPEAKKENKKLLKEKTKENADKSKKEETKELKEEKTEKKELPDKTGEE